MKGFLALACLAAVAAAPSAALAAIAPGTSDIAALAAAAKPESPPTPEWAKLWDGVAAFGADRYQEAIRIARELVSTASDPDVLIEAEHLLVHATRWDSGYQAAITEAEKLRASVRQARPQSSEELAGLDEMVAGLKEDQASYEKALADYRKSIEQHPGAREAVRAAYQIGNAHELAGRLGEATEAYREVIRRYPEDVHAGRAISQVVGIYQRIGQGGRVEDSCKSLVAKHPDSYYVGFAAGKAVGRQAFHRGGIKAALDSLQKLVPMAHARSLVGAGVRMAVAGFFIQQNGSVAAEHVWTELKRDYPGTAAARAASGRLAGLRLARAREQYEKGQFMMAVRELETALAEEGCQGRDRAFALHTVGLCYQRDNQVAEAIGWLEQAMQADKDMARSLGTLYQIAVCWYRQGDFETAVENFQTVLKDDPKGPLAEFAKERIRQCQEMLAIRAGSRPETPPDSNEERGVTQ